MASRGDIYLGESGYEKYLTPVGRSLKLSDTEISVQERTQNGNLKKDIVCTKLKITIDYTDIDGVTLASMLALYNLHKTLSVIIFSSATLYTQHDVLMQPLDRTRSTHRGIGYWSGVSIVLDEV
jgi:hypothetical protein